ncbi:PAS domain S-box protein [Pedobacter alpinus]|uniref:histidine kinase n=1 Tax=Pedobacter alpinus TaxID=1590643 RepID=A0ABW5TQQ4_9SPHI
MATEPKDNIQTFFEINNLGLLVANHAQAMLAYWDKNQLCRFANHSYLKWFGKTREEMVDKMSMLDLLGPALYQENLPYITEVLKGNPQQFERVIKTPSGETINSIANYYPDIFEGKVRGFFVHVADITQVKALEKDIAISEAKFRGILENAPDATLIVNQAGVIQLINSQAENLFGYLGAELLKNSFFMLLPNRHRDEIKSSWSEFVENIISNTGNTLLNIKGLRKNGEEFPIEINVAKIQTEDEINICASIRDISDRMKSESEVKRNNERNKIFIEQAPNAIAMFDLQMCYLAASERWIADYQLKGKEIIGRSHYEIFPEIGDDWKAIHKACLNGEINKCDEASFERSDGSLQWITWDVRPWYISEGNIGGILMYTADITNLKEKDQEKRRIEEILDRTNEVARIGTWEVDLVRNKVSWSRITKEIHEVDPEFEPQLETAINFYKEGTSRDTINLAISEAIANGTYFDEEVELVTRKGNLYWTRAIGQAEFKNQKCVRLYGVFQDIDNKKRAEEALHLLNEELHTIFNAGYVSIIGTDLQGNITHFNKGAEHLLQYSAKEMIGIKTLEIIHLKEEVLKRGEELSELFNQKIEEFNVFVQVPKIDGVESREWTYVRKDGTFFPVQLVITAIKNSKGEVVGFLGVGTDISDIKKAENELKSILEITTDQNERLKNFAHIVSHNLRSHTGNLEMVIDLYVEENQEVVENEYIILLQTALKNLKETISNLNEVVLMNNSTENLEPLNLYKIIESASKSVGQIASSALVEIKNNVDSEMSIMGISAYTESIILNFITNGIKYRSNDRPSFVSFSAVQLKEYVLLTIEDNGIGIDLKRNRAKLFGMYKTFNGNPDARGIGLFITKNQIEAMGGKIEVESELNKGTIFKVYLKHEKN